MEGKIKKIWLEKENGEALKTSKGMNYARLSIEGTEAVIGDFEPERVRAYIDGKIKEGMTVEYEAKKSGNYTNMKSLIETTNGAEVQANTETPSDPTETKPANQTQIPHVDCGKEMLFALEQAQTAVDGSDIKDAHRKVAKAHFGEIAISIFIDRCKQRRG